MTRFTNRVFARIVALAGTCLWLGSAIPVDAAAAQNSSTARRGVAKSATKQTASRTNPAQKSSSRKTVRKSPAKKRGASRTRYSSSRSASRRVRLARARLAQRQRELRELQQPRYKLDDTGSTVPDVRAEAAIVYNPTTHEILWAENAEAERSIASITKVMTAVVFLEHEFDLGREVVIDRADMRGASTTYLRGGERINVDDVLHLLLIASDNVAARTLARVSLLGYDGFIQRMNTKAQELGLTATHYADPSGLDARNVSSAYDMARLIAFAASDERISPIMRKAEHSLTTSRRTLTVHNTNRLVGSEVDVRGGKTGFISKAGYCLATLLKLPQSDDQVAVVVLGAHSNAARFWETRHIFNWLASKTSSVVKATNPQ